MKITCITVGKKHDPDLVKSIEKYQKRLQSYVQFNFDYIPVSNKVTESETILKRISIDDRVILLDETGKMFTNPQLGQLFSDMQNASVKQLVIIIGGAYGVDQTVTQRANHIVSLSPLVFPHQLVRLIITEQLYRSFNSLAGGKYHHL